MNDAKTNDTKKDIPQMPPTGRWVVTGMILLLLGLFSLVAAAIIGAFVSTGDSYDVGNVALIKIRGVITIDSPGELLGDDATGSSDIVEMIEKADSDPAIEAILLDINSPGGSPVASYEVMKAVKDANKTTVAWIREAGASGAYWIASAADYIVANPMSITGSIGVYGSYLDFSQFIGRYNISYQRFVSGEYKDMGNPLREMSDDEREILQKSLDKIRDEFVKSVAENRNLDEAVMNETANGLFYLGMEAKELGLIDKLGGKDDAIMYIEDKEEIKADIVEFKNEKTFMELLAGVMSGQSFSLGLGMGRGMYDDSVSIKT